MKKPTTISEQDGDGIGAALTDFLDESRLGRMVRAEAARDGATREEAPAWRLMLVGRGRWRLRFPVGSEVRADTLGPGEGLLLPPGTWFLQDGGTTRTKLFLQLNARHTYAHFSWHRPEAAAHRLIWQNVMSPVSGAAWHTLRALGELAPDAPATAPLLRALLLEVRAHLLAGTEPAGGGKAARIYANICRYLEGNYHLPITRETVAREFRLHPNHVSRLFRTQGGESFQAQLERLRMGRAEQLARRRVFTADELAAACGYGNTANFRKAFRRHHGVPPGRFG